MVEWTLDLMNRLGYVGIVLLMVLENLFPPLPSELILPAAGFAAARGELHLAGVAASGALGSVIGTLPLYWLGRAVGEERLVRWADRYGRWLTVRGQDVRRADAWFDRYGWSAVLFGRMVPGIRSLLSLPAGMSGMPLPTFVLYSAVGSGLWALLLSGAGYLLGDHYEVVGQYVGPVGTGVLALLLGYAVVWVLRRRRQA
ncbi:DedA family protein [Deinococcus aquiradiocola]|uniref:Alkaline phosphatase n=1 Tax=Deinococcus aquiradiocola TaxID=393059 RepID=A0A917UVG2_9DEIO|nr:DedA family protein [Deinococcus aquiradiocola]GGJ88166.1 alkaline phosphatase [Deinococcus aquiradiocola]